MTFGRIKLRPADVLFSRYLRLKIGHCEVCGKPGQGDEGITGLCVSHYWGRRNESVRFNPDNITITCPGCHRKFHEMPAIYYMFQKKKLGEKAYKQLELEKETYRKRDDKLIILLYKKLLKELN